MVITKEIGLNTRGHCDIHDITDQVADVVRGTGLSKGIVVVFTPSATSGLTTVEYESGALADLGQLLNEIAPAQRDYRHNLRWGDGNGHSHVRAALLGASLTVPFVDSDLTLGTWQQIIFVDFDNRSRQRRIVAQIVGE